MKLAIHTTRLFLPLLAFLFPVASNAGPETGTGLLSECKILSITPVKHCMGGMGSSCGNDISNVGSPFRLHTQYRCDRDVKEPVRQQLFLPGGGMQVVATNLFLKRGVHTLSSPVLQAKAGRYQVDLVTRAPNTGRPQQRSTNTFGFPSNQSRMSASINFREVPRPCPVKLTYSITRYH